MIVVDTLKGSVTVEGSLIDLRCLHALYGAGKLSPLEWLQSRGYSADMVQPIKVALSYAAFLSKSLEAQLKAGLGDQAKVERVREKITVNLRASSRSARKVFCDGLAQVGIDNEDGVKAMTNALYEALFGASLGNLWREFGAGDRFREALPVRQLLSLAMAETNAAMALFEMDANALEVDVKRTVVSVAQSVAVTVNHQLERRAS